MRDDQMPKNAWVDVYRPTEHLRFVVRYGHRVLQQKYVSDYEAYPDQWRDVQLAEEET